MEYRKLLGRGLLLMSVSGCADDVPLDGDGCPLYNACDIRKDGCQKKVFETVVCNRAVEGSELPPVEVVDFDAWYQEQLDDPWTPDEWLWTRKNRGVATFGLAPAGAKPEHVAGSLASAVGATYSSLTGTVTIIDRGAPLDDPEMVSLLAHEFVHAQQDYEVDLSIFGDTLPPGLDSFLARRAMIEGEAVLYQTMMAVRLAGNAVHEVEWHSWIHDWQAASREGMVTDHFPVTMSAGYFPYPFGVGVMYDAWVYDGPHEVRRVRDSLMVSTRQVVAGFGGTELFDGPWTEDLTDIEVPQLGAEYEFVLLDTLGSFVIEAFAARAGCEDVSVESLRGDTFAAAVHNPTDNVVASMRLSIADNAAQTGWRGCLAGAGDWNLRMDSGDITLIASEDPAVLETLEGVEWGPAPFRANR